MKIETKYSPGEWVWQMHNNRACEIQVKAIGISAVYGQAVATKYMLETANEDRQVSCTEDEIFPTKEALLQSL